MCPSPASLSAYRRDPVRRFIFRTLSFRWILARCQKLAEEADWFVPKTQWRLCLRNRIWRMLPHTPWKNMMLEIS
jgi:hypothetical protein